MNFKSIVLACIIFFNVVMTTEVSALVRLSDLKEKQHIQLIFRFSNREVNAYKCIDNEAQYKPVESYKIQSFQEEIKTNAKIKPQSIKPI